MTDPDAALQAAARLSDFLENELIMFDAGADGKLIDIPMCLRLEALGDGLRAALADAPPPEPTAYYRCHNCGRSEHGCECEGGGQMVPTYPTGGEDILSAPATAPPPEGGLDVERRLYVLTRLVDRAYEQQADRRLNLAVRVAILKAHSYSQGGSSGETRALEAEFDGARLARTPEAE